MLHLIPPALVGDLVPPVHVLRGLVEEELKQQGQQHMKYIFLTISQKKKKSIWKTVQKEN